MAKKLLILLLLLNFCNIAQAVSYVDDANCQAAWLMDTDVAAGALPDSSQNSNTGQVLGDGEPDFATASPPAAYSTGYYVFAGDNDTVTVDDNNVFTTSAMSAGGWYRADADTQGSALIGKYAASNLEWVLGLSSGDVYFLIYDQTAGRYIARFDASSDTILNDNGWHHIYGVWDGGVTTAAIDIYIDGVAVDDQDFTNGNITAMRNTNSIVEMGHTGAWGASNYWEGTQDEIAFFDDPLTLTEINDIMDNGLAGAVAAGYPQGRFFMDYEFC